MPTKTLVFVLSLLILSSVSAQSSVKEEMSESLSLDITISTFVIELVEALLSSSMSDGFYSAFFRASATYAEFSLISLFGAVVAFTVSFVPCIILILMWYLPLPVPALLGAFIGFLTTPLLFTPLAALLSLISHTSKVLAPLDEPGNFVISLPEILLGTSIPLLSLISSISNIIKSTTQPPIFGLLFLPLIFAILGALTGFLFPFALLISSLLIGFLLGIAAAQYVEERTEISSLLAEFLIGAHSYASPYLNRFYKKYVVCLFQELKIAVKTLSEPLAEMINAM
jgi:hypothetical protein